MNSFWDLKYGQVSHLPLPACVPRFLGSCAIFIYLYLSALKQRKNLFLTIGYDKKFSDLAAAMKWNLHLWMIVMCRSAAYVRAHAVCECPHVCVVCWLKAWLRWLVFVFVVCCWPLVTPSSFSRPSIHDPLTEEEVELLDANIQWRCSARHCLRDNHIFGVTSPIRAYATLPDQSLISNFTQPAEVFEESTRIQ